MVEPIKIHPFDLYVLLRDNPSVTPVMKGTLRVLRPDYGYSCDDPLIEFGGTLYVQTTTVQPVTTEFN